MTTIVPSVTAGPKRRRMPVDRWFTSARLVKLAESSDLRARLAIASDLGVAHLCRVLGITPGAASTLRRRALAAWAILDWTAHRMRLIRAGKKKRYPYRRPTIDRFKRTKLGRLCPTAKSLTAWLGMLESGDLIALSRTGSGRPRGRTSAPGSDADWRRFWAEVRRGLPLARAHAAVREAAAARGRRFASLSTVRERVRASARTIAAHPHLVRGVRMN